MQKPVALVVATTGLEPPQIERLRTAAQQIPLLWAPSMSLTVNLTMKLCEVAGNALADQDADVEILERQPPLQGRRAQRNGLEIRRDPLPWPWGQTAHRHGRFGRPGKRPHEEIGYHAIRVGDNPGEHTIVFGMLGETIELTVRASNRDCYASGALAAAKFLVGKPVGLYGMNDVLGL